MPGNIISMMIGIEFARDRRGLVRPLWETVRNLRDEDLRQTVARWLNRLKQRYNLNLPGLEELLAMEDVTVLTSRLDETLEGWRDEALAQGREQGIEQGHKEGVAETLAHIVRAKFGQATADGLAPLLGSASPAELRELVDHALAAQTSAELVARVDDA